MTQPTPPAAHAAGGLAEVGVAWQLTAEDATVLAAGFGEVAAHLGAQVPADARDPVASVHAALARFPAPWLLLFDNAADLASVAGFLPPAGPGRVLITSQYPDWPGQAIDVPVLDPDVAAGFLISRTGDPDQQSARDLAGVLGGLPLALGQAAYVQATGMTLARYLSVFRGRAADLLARGQAAGHPTSVAATLGLALSLLGDEAAPAVGLLRLLACCASEPIPIWLLLQPCPGLTDGRSGEVAAVLVSLWNDELAVDDAMAALRRFSLVTPAGDELVLVHRLVQAVTLAQVSADVAGQWEQAAAALVGAAVPADPELPANWRVYAMLLLHALTAGDAAGARDQFAVLLPIQERVLGREHRRTLADRGGLAIWTGAAGDAAGPATSSPRCCP